MSIQRIAFVVKYFPTVSETFIVNQINGLLDLGYEVHIYAYNKVETSIVHESLKTHDLLNKVHYFVKSPKSKVARLVTFVKWTKKYFFEIKWQWFFKSLNFFKFGKEAYTLKLFFESQWFLVSYDFELVHAHFGMNGNRIAYVKSHGLLPGHLKLINTFHGYDLMPNKLQDYKTEYKYLFEEATAFTVNTPYLESLLLQVNEYQKPCYVLPVGLDTAFFKKTQQRKETTFFNLVFCGKLIPLKGPDLAVDILRKLHENGFDNTCLHIIGDGPMRVELEKKIQHHQLEVSVFLHGTQSQTSIKQFFSEADAFVLPGRYDLECGRAETQGLVIQEAQAMELPVIISDVGGMKYGLLPGKSGFIVKEGDLDSFVKVIETLILDTELKLKMGKVGREYVQAYYDNHVLLNKLLVVYEANSVINLN